jgi:hypothetical protein
MAHGTIYNNKKEYDADGIISLGEFGWQMRLFLII